MEKAKYIIKDFKDKVYELTTDNNGKFDIKWIFEFMVLAGLAILASILWLFSQLVTASMDDY